MPTFTFDRPIVNTKEEDRRRLEEFINSDGTCSEDFRSYRLCTSFFRCGKGKKRKGFERVFCKDEEGRRGAGKKMVGWKKRWTGKRSTGK